MKKIKFTLLPLSVFVVLNVQANSDQLDTIDVVSDNYSPQVSNVAAKGVVKVRQATKMSDVLRTVPGVNVNGGRSVVERYNIRGVSEEYLTVTVDGARQNGYAFHHSGNYGIDPEILKRVDIDVGSNSVVAGAGSLGGSIKFETVDAADMLEEGQNFGGKVKYGWGSNGNSHQTTTMLYGRAGALDLLGYFNYRHQENGKDGNGLKNQNEGHLQDYLFKAKYNISPDQWVKFSAERYNNTALSCFRANFGMCLGDVPQPGEEGFINANHGKAYTGIKRETYTLAYGYNPVNNPLVNIKANAYNTDSKTSSMGQLQTNIRTVGGSLSNTSELDLGATHHMVLFGGEYFNTKARAYSEGPNGYITKVDSTSIYLEDQIALGDFVITPGLRYDYHKARLSPTFDKHYSRFSKALGIKYLTTENLILFANYTELFKGPDAGEVTLNGSRAYSPSLEAIRGDNKEAGINFAKDNIFSGDDSFSITAKYFQTDYDNINKNINLGGFSGYQNIGAVRLKGVEASAKYRFEDLTLGLSYARARSKQTTDVGSQVKGSSGYAAFPDSGDRYNLFVNYVIPKAQLELGWNTMWVRGINLYEETNVGSRRAPVYVPGYSEKSSYSVSNAYISWAPMQVKGLELTFGIDNIFNEAYKDHSTQYYGAVDLEPGRNYKLSASYKF
ncbi:TonB-dependent receptor domain-containing protein [Rodentibacter trehalosifermentans]|uniref:TonB-dependent receptor n=1 Tax=Rodentibacter trehalosifermentans TaxID=1908263 RepID=A0A1V3IVI1_9PAST|nr:TonB-dependent receptor [Rodentibacter trehalosifermentans]OOF45922.1 TonB-dependent receptor [Rodentibacter trehalosifermentans]OOF50163.1 TonB-dependent receptor [Rodentibacter trehalosifermentans]OOF52975.1 TonB-dependent receptor [Rodentibacter trehalosifermentans]